MRRNLVWIRLEENQRVIAAKWRGLSAGWLGYIWFDITRLEYNQIFHAALSGKLVLRELFFY